MKDVADTKASNGTNLMGWVTWVVLLVVGGLLLIVPAACNIFLIVISLTTHDPYAYFEMDQTFVAYAVLPFWTTMFIAGCAFLAVSGFHTRKRIGGSSFRKARSTDTRPT